MIWGRARAGDAQRDLALCHDSNERIRRQMAQRILERTWDRASAAPALQTRLVTYLTLERRSTERPET